MPALRGRKKRVPALRGRKKRVALQHHLANFAAVDGGFGGELAAQQGERAICALAESARQAEDFGEEAAVELGAVFVFVDLVDREHGELLVVVEDLGGGGELGGGEAAQVEGGQRGLFGETDGRRHGHLVGDSIATKSKEYPMCYYDQTTNAFSQSSRIHFWEDDQKATRGHQCRPRWYLTRIGIGYYTESR